MKKLLSLIMAMAMALSCLCSSAFATGEGEKYVLMNIPYDKFYAAELANKGADVVSSATAKRLNTNMAAGSYHDSSSDKIDGAIFPVKVSAEDLNGLTKVSDDASITITYNVKGTDRTATLTGKDALFEAPAYAYYELSETPSVYKEADLDGGTWSFGEVQGQAVTSENKDLKITTGGHHTYYTVTLPLLNEQADGENVSGIVFTDSENKTYGLSHIWNIWNAELGWDDVTGDKKAYLPLAGQTITSITVLTTKNLYQVSTSLKVPVNSGASVKVDAADASAGSTTLTVSNLPDDFQAQYAVDKLEGISVSGDKLSFKAGAAAGSYTLTITDKNGKYAPVTASFLLTTDAVPAAYDADSKSLKAAEGMSSEAFASYLSSISKVNVDGKDYAATGRDAVKLIDTKTGAIDTAADAFKEKKAYEVKVVAAGYNKDLSFTLDLSESKPEPETQPKTETDAKTDTKTETDAKTETETDTKTDTKTDTEAKAKTQPQAQTISAKNVTKTLGAKAFSLGAKAKTTLSYKSSNTKVAAVDKKGKVTIKGVGEAKITITAKATDAYKSATKTVTVTVNPKGVALSKVKAGKKQLAASWKKNGAVNGYQLQYSTDKSFKKGVKTVKISKNKTVSTTVKKLSAKKKYFVRIRTFKKVGKKTYNSSWSAVKNVTVK